MVHFTQYRSINLFYSVTWYISLDMWVTPFGNLRINRYLLLPAAFRSLSRLSSALSAKASTLRSFLLDLFSVSYSVKIQGLQSKDCFVYISINFWFVFVSRMS